MYVQLGEQIERKRDLGVCHFLTIKEGGKGDKGIKRREERDKR